LTSGPNRIENGYSLIFVGVKTKFKEIPPDRFDAPKT